MKSLLTFLCLFKIAFLFAQTNSIQPGAHAEYPSVINYDTIYQYDNGIREFYVKNTGDYPLIVSNCKTSCGCLVCNWYKEPIMPGDSAKFTAKYHTARVGPINKTITFSSNAKNGPYSRIRIKGMVLPKEEEEEEEEKETN